jgi:hypothetical protein
MANVLTNNSKAVQVNLDYAIPEATVQGTPIGSIYAFLGQEDPWPFVNNVETPAQPEDTQSYFKKTFRNMFAAKKILSSNISPVIQRIDWTTNTVYEEYSDTVNMNEKDQNGLLINHFYVVNRYDQVFKCLSNNMGAVSTSEPYFQPGSYGTNNIYQGADLYKWKFMYTIDGGSKRTFMDSDWMPVPVGNFVSQPYGTTAGYGDIEVINVTNGGSGYDAVNTHIVVSVTGDGQGAVANITPTQIVGGVIQDIVVQAGNSGNNYTYANVSITAYTSANMAYISSTGSGATAIAPISPVGGHGYDPFSELACSNVMFSVDFNGTENGVIPTSGVDYRQVGLLASPVVVGSDGTPTLATGSIYNTALQLSLFVNAGATFASDEVVRQYDTNGNVVFQGTVLNFNSTNSILQLINTTGTYQINQTIRGLTSGAFGTVSNVSTPTLIPFSGYILYIENRVGVQRSDDGIEQFKFVLGF